MPERDGRIVALIARALMGEPGEAGWETLEPGDWSRLVRVAQAEGVAPLLYWKLERSGWPAAIPGEGRERLRAGLSSAYYRSAAASALLTSELGRISAALQAAGLPVLAIKGAALAPGIYPEPGLRPMSDLDLMIRRSDLAPALGALAGIGYNTLKLTYHAMLAGGPAGGVTVELHWTAVDDSARQGFARTAWFWRHTRPLHPGQATLALEPGAALLYQAAHLVLQHGAEDGRLIWLYDLHLLLDGMDEAGRQTLLADAAELGLEGVLATALGMADSRLGLAVPSELAAAPPVVTGGEPARIRAWMVQSWLALGFRDRLRWVFFFVLPDAGYIRWRYRPRWAWAWPLYYPRRWWDILRRVD